MAGSIMVRYAKKTSKQLAKERSGSHAQMKNINYSIDINPDTISYMTFENHSVDIDPDSISYMTFDNMKDAYKFASGQQEQGYHIIEVRNDNKH